MIIPCEPTYAHPIIPGYARSTIWGVTMLARCLLSAYRDDAHDDAPDPPDPRYGFHARETTPEPHNLMIWGSKSVTFC